MPTRPAPWPRPSREPEMLQCDYCGRWGKLFSTCGGCGAQVVPEPASMEPSVIVELIGGGRRRFPARSRRGARGVTTIETGENQ